MSQMNEAIAVVSADGCIAFCTTNEEIHERIKFYESKGWKANLFVRIDITEWAKRPKCTCEDPDPYFSRIIPMGYFCSNCGCEINNT